MCKRCWNILLHVAVKMKIIMDDSAITRDEIIESYNPETTIRTNFNEKKAAVKWTISIFYLYFY